MSGLDVVLNGKYSLWLLHEKPQAAFYYIGNSSGIPYIIKSLPGGMHTMCRGRLLRSCTLVRKVYKSLMSERFRELKWTCPLYSSTGCKACRRILYEKGA